MPNILKSCLRYQGSKYEMIKQHRIHEFIPPTNVNQPYCELFCGSAIMFFNIQTTCAYINDSNADLTNFWIQVLTNKEQLEQVLKYVWNGQQFIEFFKHAEPTPLNRAVAFFLNNTLGTTYLTYPSFVTKNFDVWKEKMDSARLTIFTEDYQKVLEIVDQLRNPHSKRAINENRDLHAVFYADPPYFGSEEIYQQGTFDHIQFAKNIHKYADIGHHIIISYNKCPEILDLYKDWYIEEFNLKRLTQYATDRTELLISNQKLRRYSQKYAKETDLITLFQHKK